MPSRRKVTRPRRFPELAASELRWVCRPSVYDLTVAERDQSPIGIIGQERAIRALKLGIELHSPGYNVFVRGIAGTGRASTVQKILERVKRFGPVPPDRCYVHHFAKPDEPKLLTLPRGYADRIRADMERFVREMQAEVSALLASEEHSRKREKIASRYEGEGDRIIERFERTAERKGFALKRVREGSVSRPELFPIVQGQAVSIAQMQKAVSEGKIPQKKAALLARQYQSLRQTLDATVRINHDLLSRMESDISDLDKSEVRAVLQRRCAAMLERYPAAAADPVGSYLREVVEEIISSLDLFRQALVPAGAALPGSSGSDGAPAAPDPASRVGLDLQKLLDRFKINVILDGRHHGECPVIVETHPTYRRLFGYFEKSIDPSGHWSTDYTRIRPGSLLAADGGYLVVTTEDLLSHRTVWLELKRTLISKSLAIIEEGGGLLMPTIAMKPEPIPINLKVIMIGHRRSYETLMENEPDFKRIFKVIADFDEEMDLNAKTLRQYAAFVLKVCADEGLGDPERMAVAAVAEFGARRAGHQGKLSTRFGEIADLLREADYWRRQDGSGRRVLARHVRTALKEDKHRRSLIEDKLREMIRTGQILIEVKGERAGQVSGLVIQNTGGHQFGIPARITATVSPGTAGIINIEREASLSGRSHTKGALIIGGFVREKFGAVRPVTLTASLAFDGPYGGAEGDSASSTEIFALLSALSGLPIRQGIAVTGSVDQMGDIQPAAGINDKIEAFYKVCLLKGLTGEQGVIVPVANLRDLMLDEEVVEAVRKKRFHVYPVRTVAEGMEVLTGMPAGERDATGRYTESSIFGRVDQRLAQFHALVGKHAPASPL